MKFIIQSLLFSSIIAVKINKWGEVDPSLSPEAIYGNMGSDATVKDYVLDGPGGSYLDAVAPPPGKSSLLQLHNNKRVWGEVAEEDSFAYHQAQADENSNEKEYVEAGPEPDYLNDLIKYDPIV